MRYGSAVFYTTEQQQYQKVLKPPNHNSSVCFFTININTI